MSDSRLLKKDLLGSVQESVCDGSAVIIRDTAPAAAGLGWLARVLMRREARALAALAPLDGVPDLIRVGRDSLVRSYLSGSPMQQARPTDGDYFKAAARLLRRIHRAGVAHNDLAKETNLLVRPDGRPAIIDFQLAILSPRRGRAFRLAAREDLRHLLKHKRTYCEALLTSRERQILSNPGLSSIALAKTVKPLYMFITRRLLGWEDREGAGDRGARQDHGDHR